MRSTRASREEFNRDQTGATAVEFALISPLFIVLLMGIVSYGGYFWLGHTVQQMANDAARATIAGLTDEERVTLAEQSLSASVRANSQMNPERLDVDVARSAGYLTVSVVYDANGSVFWAFDKLLPMPSPQLARTASIRMGGF